MWGGGQRKGCSLSRLSSYSFWMILSVPILHYTPQAPQIVYGRILSLLAAQIFAFITMVCQLLVYFRWPSWLPLFSSHALAPVSTGAGCHLTQPLHAFYLTLTSLSPHCSSPSSLAQTFSPPGFSWSVPTSSVPLGPLRERLQMPSSLLQLS